MGKHTAGPWRHSRLRKLVRAAAGEVVAWLDLDTEECEANGNLIAAAPELLEALEEVSGLLRNLWKERGEPAGIIEIALMSAETVVAKAKGEEG